MEVGDLDVLGDLTAPVITTIQGDITDINLDIDKVNQNLVLNAFRIAVNGSLTQFNMVDGIVDEYEDETGIAVAEFTPFTQYKLNETTGTTVTDTGTGLNNGTASVDISNLTVTGKINNAFEFNGTDEFVNIDGALTGIASDTTGSFSFWISPSAIDLRQVFTFGDTDALSHLWCYIDSTGYLEVGIRISGTYSFRARTPASTFSAGTTWYYVTIVQDGVEPKIYVDSVSQTLTFSVDTDKTAWFSDITGLDNGRIACRNFNSSGNGQFYEGKIDDFRYYSNKSLTSDEVALLYNSGTGTETLTLGECINISYNSTDDYYSPYTASLTVSPFAQFKLNDTQDNTTVVDVGTGANNGIASTNTANLADEGKIRNYAKFGNTGAYWNGTSSYLSIPDHADWDVVGSNSDNWTIDFWVKHNTLPSIVAQHYINQWESSNDHWRIWHGGSSLGFYALTGGTPFIAMAGGVISDTNWHHVCIIKNGSSYGIYLDGTQTAYYSSSSTDTYTASLIIGKDGTNTYYMDGYMDEIRIIKSNAFTASPNVGLTDTITVPTSAHTSDANTKLLLHCDGDYVDSGNTVHTVTNNGVSFGGFDFNGSSEYINIDSVVADILSDTTGSFSFWYNSDALDDTQYVISIADANADTRFFIYPYKSLPTYPGLFTLSLTQAGTTHWSYDTPNSSIPSDGTWYHIVVVQDGISPKVYINGVLQTLTVGVNTNPGYWFNNMTGLDTGRIGCRNYNSSGNVGYFNGKIDDFRYYQNKALTSDEVALLYNSGTGTEESQPSNPPENMTLISDTFTAEAEPDTARIVLFEEDVDTITINTDLKAYVSRNGGTTYSQVTLVNVGEYETGRNILAASVDISGQSAGTDIKYKIETANNKDLKVHGTGLLWD